VNLKKEIMNAEFDFYEGREKEAYESLIYFGVMPAEAREFIYKWYLERDATVLKTYFVMWETPICGEAR
jgi:hypothetical protein